LACPAAGAGAPDGLIAVDRNNGNDDRRLSDHYSVHAPEHPFCLQPGLEESPFGSSGGPGFQVTDD
jgi:hypothetical protein